MELLPLFQNANQRCAEAINDIFQSIKEPLNEFYCVIIVIMKLLNQKLFVVMTYLYCRNRKPFDDFEKMYIKQKDI